MLKVEQGLWIGNYRYKSVGMLRPYFYKHRNVWWVFSEIWRVCEGAAAPLVTRFYQVTDVGFPDKIDSRLQITLSSCAQGPVACDPFKSDRCLVAVS